MEHIKFSNLKKKFTLIVHKAFAIKEVQTDYFLKGSFMAWVSLSPPGEMAQGRKASPMLVLFCRKKYRKKGKSK